MLKMPLVARLRFASFRGLRLLRLLRRLLQLKSLQQLLLQVLLTFLFMVEMRPVRVSESVMSIVSAVVMTMQGVVFVRPLEEAAVSVSLTMDGRGRGVGVGRGVDVGEGRGRGARVGVGRGAGRGVLAGRRASPLLTVRFSTGVPARSGEASEVIAVSAVCEVGNSAASAYEDDMWSVSVCSSGCYSGAVYDDDSAVGGYEACGGIAEVDYVVVWSVGDDAGS